MDGWSQRVYRPRMNVPILMWSAAGFAVLAAFAGWRGARLPNPQRGPRMIPWRWIMLLAATGAFIAVMQSFAEIKAGF